MWSERSVAMAKWIVDWYDDTVTCSECGAREDAFVTRSAYGGEWAVDGNSIYCPTCGARMTDRIVVEPIWQGEFDDEDDD